MANRKTWMRIFAACVAVFVLSMCVVMTTITGNGTVDANPVSFVTDEGVLLEGTLFVPHGVTAENPAPGIMVAPGGNTPHTFYYSYELELARRGYVVLAYDYYGTVGSGMVAGGVGSSGAIAAMKYLSDLSFVDSNMLATTGHSNGGGQALAGITCDYAKDAEKRAVVYIGCGVAGSAEQLTGVNVCGIWANWDEAGQGMMWDTVHKDALRYPGITDLTGTTNETFEVGKMYGDLANGTGRVLYNPTSFHSASNLAPSTITNIINFMDGTFGRTSAIPATQHIYLWHELAVTLAALALCMMIFPVGMLLADSPYFAATKKEIAPATGTAKDWKFWLFLLLPGIISALLVKNSIIQGQNLMGKAPRLFNIQSTDGFIWWFFLSCLVSIAFIVVRKFIDKNFDLKGLLANFKTTPVALFKAIVLGLGAVAVPYLFGMIGERLTGGWYARLFQTYMVSIDSTRWYEFPVYFLMFFVLFAIFAGIQTNGLRLKNGKGKADYWIMLIANALPALLFCGYVFGKLVFTGYTAITGREMSRANGAMLGMLIIYFVIAAVVNKFYKKTGNVYVVAAVNAAFVTWLSINTQQFIV
ncbi:MAG: hypothetical protein IKK21_01165 [Clostridia bacterium]|nr:hypothetical protein [Clostridia bacterium]